MFFKRKYVYFVSFWNADQSKSGFGFGNGEITAGHKIKSIEDIRKIEALLDKDSSFKHKVFSYQLLK